MSNEKRIKLLPEAAQHMIAAGEVVESPASVIKELVENSIDAGASNIVIEAVESGFKKITVRDNGSGIYKDDISLAVAEHATSKISEFSDIQRVSSFGFRGEALSSIGAVSELVILSRRAEEQIGGKLEVKNGKITVSDYAGPAGTAVLVENLFYNVPARKKFMKSLPAESRAIREAVVRAALSSYEAGFSCVINDKRVLTLAGAATQAQRIEQIFGNEEFKNLQEEHLSDISVKITGWVSRPHFMKASRSEQFLFVNNRPVDMKHFSFLLSRAYESAAPQGKYPAAFVYITIKPDLVDVNIHPAKKEIKFFDQRYVEGLIVSLIRKSLAGREQTFNLFESSANNTSVIPVTSADSSSQPQNTGRTVYSERSGIEGFAYPVQGMNPSGVESADPESLKIRDIQHMFSFDNRTDVSSEAGPGLKIIGILFGTYILAESGDTLKILDFHAAHERINYDRIIETGKRGGKGDSQMLIFPEIVPCPGHAYHDINDILPDLNAKGFDIEPFSDESFVVRAVPPEIEESSVKDFMGDLFELIETADDFLIQREHHIASRIACHASRRRNDALSREEMESLFGRILSGAYALTCPHGRPYLYTVNHSEFEKMFRR